MHDIGQKNIQLVTWFYEAIGRGDLAAARRVLDRDIEWIESDRTALWFRGTHLGACAVFNELILPAYGWLADFHAELDQILSIGEHVIVIGHFRGYTRMEGTRLNARTTHVWTLRNDRAVRVRTYNNPAHWSEVLNKPSFEQAAA
jgi:ketosteroid isomerase-like protein